MSIIKGTEIRKLDFQTGVYIMQNIMQNTGEWAGDGCCGKIIKNSDSGKKRNGRK